MSFYKKRKITTLGDENQNKVQVPETIKKSITTQDDEDDKWGFSLSKSSSSPKKSPKKKAATQQRKTKTTKTSTPTPVKKSTGSWSSRLIQAKKQATTPVKTNLPTIFERKQANELLDSITDEEDIRYTISSMKPENMRPMIRFATDDRKKNKTLTPIQQTFLQELNFKIKTENPQTRMIHEDEETRDVANQKINWTKRESSLPRGVIVIAHTHGGFVHSNNLIKYPRNVNDTLESVSTYYLSDIGSRVCNIREDYKQFDERFIRSLLHGPLEEEGLSIKDISEKTQEGFKIDKFKTVYFGEEKKNILENYFDGILYSSKGNSSPTKTPGTDKTAVVFNQSLLKFEGTSTDGVNYTLPDEKKPIMSPEVSLKKNLISPNTTIKKSFISLKNAKNIIIPSGLKVIGSLDLRQIPNLIIPDDLEVTNSLYVSPGVNIPSSAKIGRIVVGS